MGRWSQYDSDDGRLPEGMERVGYDADTQTYSYKDEDGSFWEGAPGAKYGLLHRAGQSERDYQRPTRAKVKFAFSSDSSEEDLPSPANGPHRQLFGLLSNGYGKLLVTLSLVYTGIIKRVKYKKQQAQRPSKKHPQRHTQRRRRRPHKWNEK